MSGAYAQTRSPRVERLEVGCARADRVDLHVPQARYCRGIAEHRAPKFVSTARAIDEALLALITSITGPSSLRPRASQTDLRLVLSPESAHLTSVRVDRRVYERAI
jgi:hypothetical protein